MRYLPSFGSLITSGTGLSGSSSSPKKINRHRFQFQSSIAFNQVLLRVHDLFSIHNVLRCILESNFGEIMNNILGLHYLLRGLSRPKKSAQLDHGWPRNLVRLSLVAAITLFSSPTLTSGAYNFSWSAPYFLWLILKQTSTE
jgi:hypothetical protein